MKLHFTSGAQSDFQNRDNEMNTKLIKLASVAASLLLVSSSALCEWNKLDISNATLDVNLTYNATTKVYSYKYKIVSPLSNIAGIHSLDIFGIDNTYTRQRPDPDIISDNSVVYDAAPLGIAIQVGIESPNNWEASLSTIGTFGWNSVTSAYDIVPGGESGTFTIHSKYPPAQAKFEMRPMDYSGDDAPYEIYGESCEITPDCKTPDQYFKEGITAGPASTYSQIDSTGNPVDYYDLFRFTNPLSLNPTYPIGTTKLDLIVHYNSIVFPNTISATLDQQNISNMFSPIPGVAEIVTIPLHSGRNILTLSISGENKSGKGQPTRTETAKFTIIVK
jgi:hypothetical protein